MKKALEDISNYQYGLFTASQAETSGYSRKHHAYHVKNKHWEKVQHGLYKMWRAEENFNFHCMKWILWSRNKRGQIQGVISNKTALAVYDLVDKDSGEIHLTVSKDFRKRKIPENEIVVHKEDLPLSELEKHGPFMTTKLFRTLKDTKGELESKGRWNVIAEKVAKSGKLTDNELFMLGIINRANKLLNVNGDSIFNAGDDIYSVMHEGGGRDESYYRAQDAKKIFESIENQRSWSMSASTHSVRKSSQGGFTLVELLVVIAIISVLAGMLLPALENALDMTRSAACMSNLKQHGAAANMYADDYEDYFPHAGEAYGNNITGNGCWKPMIAPYHGIDELIDSNLERGVFNCPSQQDGNCGVSTYGDGGFYGGYAWNWLYLGWRNTPENGLVTPHAAFVKRSQLKKPSRTIEIQGSTDMISTSTPYQNFYIYPNSSSRAAYRHNGGPNILWADSHASWHLQEEIDDNYDWYKRD